MYGTHPIQHICNTLAAVCRLCCCLIFAATAAWRHHPPWMTSVGCSGCYHGYISSTIVCDLGTRLGPYSKTTRSNLDLKSTDFQLTKTGNVNWTITQTAIARKLIKSIVYIPVSQSDPTPLQSRIDEVSSGSYEPRSLSPARLSAAS